MGRGLNLPLVYHLDQKEEKLSEKKLVAINEGDEFINSQV